MGLPATHGGERQCRRFAMLGGEGVRERLPGEVLPKTCDFGCALEGPCFIEAGSFDAAAYELVETWALCGGADRPRTWPRAGGLAAQDAGLVRAFLVVDGLVDQARNREARRAEIAAKRSGRVG